MAQFTADESDEAARQFHALAMALFQKRLEFLRGGLQLNDPLILQLQSRQITLNGIANQYALEAASLTLDDADGVTGLIESALNKANAAIKTAMEIEKVVSIASAAINLSQAIFSADAGQIAAASEALLQTSPG